MVMDKVTDVIDSVMDESIGSDGCDDGDGIFQKRTAHAPSQGACGRSKSPDFFFLASSQTLLTTALQAFVVTNG